MASLEESREFGGDYQALFEQSVLPMALVSMRGEPHVVAASQGFLKAFGLRRAAVMGQPIASALAAHESSDLAIAIRRCLMTSESLQADVGIHGDAGRKVVRLTVRDAASGGFADHIVLEAETGAQAALPAHRLTSRFDRTRPQDHSLTYIHDLKSNLVRYADAGLAPRLALGVSPVPYQDLMDQVHPDDRMDPAEVAAKRRALSDDEFVNATRRVRGRDGEWRLINFRSQVFRRDRDGAVRMMLGIATDVTDYASPVIHETRASVHLAEENERARIGRELHDSTAQYLVAADLGLARVLRSSDLSAEERARLEGVQASLATAQTEMRAFTYVLHPPELRGQGLFKAVERFCVGFARRSGLLIAFNANEAARDLPEDVEHALFRVAQEALMNVYRHAFARRVSVTLRLKDRVLALEVRDDGIGVDGIERLENGGVGVAGMRVRMEEIGGDLRLDSSGPGFAVIARVRVPPQQAAIRAKGRSAKAPPRRSPPAPRSKAS